jgi:ApaG protein
MKSLLVKKLYKTSLKALKATIVVPELSYYHCMTILGCMKRNDKLFKFFEKWKLFGTENETEIIPKQFYFVLYTNLKNGIYGELKNNTNELSNEKKQELIQGFFEYISEMNPILKKVSDKNSGKSMDKSKGSIKSTNGIKVKTNPNFQQKNGEKYIFSYKIEITNESEKTVQLKSRFWEIFEKQTQTYRIVEGEGVVGQQPILKPGEFHQYESFCDLNHPEGTMKGHFNFIETDSPIETEFKVEVGEFRFHLKE